MRHVPTPVVNHRVRHLKDENGIDERLSLLVDLHAKRALEQLATRYKVTQRAMLKTLITHAEPVTR